MGLLEGKVAVITGAGSGMAKASTKVFVREGAKVVAADISGAEKDTAAEVGGSVLPVHCDVTSEADVEALLQAALDEFGRVDAMLNVAGIGSPEPLHELTMAEYDRVLDVNLRGVLLGMKYGIRAMIAVRRGRHRELVVRRWPQCLNAAHRHLLGEQGGGHRSDQGGRGRIRVAGSPRERRLPGLHPHRDHGRVRR